jgi:hypothetical protein
MNNEEKIRYRDAFPKDYTIPKEYAFHRTPELSEWSCYMFGNRPGGGGIVYRPNKGKEPNWFVRWMMKICFDCLWVKEMK